MNRASVLVAMALASCSFDGSALTDRSCETDGDCAPGFICTGGYCLVGGRRAPGPDVGRDSSAPDVVLVDVPDGADTGGELPDLPACTPRAEECNGADDDCDGVVDSGVAPGVCTTGVGGCERTGASVCIAGALRCDAAPGVAREETCDGVDEDCDGVVDEVDGAPMTRTCYPRDRGELVFGCREGQQTCEGGAWSDCRGAAIPLQEVCNGIDDDCNGIIDEACGCADGERDAYIDGLRWPDIAGCAGTWAGSRSLRAPATDAGVCGDDRGTECAAPADLCAEGWRPCGVEMTRSDLVEAVGGREGCLEAAGAGRWVAAASHCHDDGWPQCRSQSEPSCYEWGACSEPVCCGFDCIFAACPNSFIQGGTLIAAFALDGCGRMPSTNVDGVLCCRVEEEE